MPWAPNPSPNPLVARVGEKMEGSVERERREVAEGGEEVKVVRAEVEGRGTVPGIPLKPHNTTPPLNTGLQRRPLGEREDLTLDSPPLFTHPQNR